MSAVCNESFCGLPLEIGSDGICKKYELIIGSFDHLHTLGKVEFVNKLFDDMFQLMPEAEKGSYYELDKAHYIHICSRGYDKTQISQVPLRAEELVAGLERGFTGEIEVLQSCDATKNNKRFNQEAIVPLKGPLPSNHHTTLYATVNGGGARIGLLCIDNFSDVPFSTLSIRTLKYFAQLLSSYCEHRVNQQRVSELHVELIQSLISSMEVNDPYTENHGKRVGYYAKRLGDFLGLSSDSVIELETSGLLHDIGKIGIPSGILNKPDKLLAEEYVTIQKHPAYTKKILEKIKGLNKISEYTYCHHERYDGNGYPRGLKGSEIPYEAQILSVADAFDAMTSDRAYRNALTASEAAEVILSQSGKQFNPEVSKVAAMLLPILHHMMNRGDQEMATFNAELYERITYR